MNEVVIYFPKSMVILARPKVKCTLKNTRIYLHFPNREKISEILYNPKQKRYGFLHKNFYALTDCFFRFFTVIEAAGGLVSNDNNEILMIERMNKWDLPKGKIEASEDKKTAALREVQEETGLSKIRIRHYLTTTYHVYIFENKYILKKVYWYKMTTHINTNEYFIPQEEEQITNVAWVASDVLPTQIVSRTYPSIVQVFNADKLLKM